MLKKLRKLFCFGHVYRTDIVVYNRNIMSKDEIMHEWVIREDCILCGKTRYRTQHTLLGDDLRERVHSTRTHGEPLKGPGL